MSRARDTADQINRINSSAADATAITVDSSENVGIGTSSPAGVLHANSSGHTKTYITSGTSNDAQINFGDSDDNDIGGIHYDNAQNSMKFLTNTSERLRIDSDGLKFNGDTAAANALDDYEFGSGNATITGSGGGTITTSGDKTYYYTKIGNLVHFQVEFTLTGIAGCSGATQIALPFQSRDYVAGSLRAYTATYTGNSLFCEAHPSGTQVLLKSQSSGNASHDVLSSTTSYYFVTLTYLTW